MATKKTTPQSRARARSAAKRGDAARYTKSELMRPGKVSESGTAAYSAVRLAQAAWKNVRGGVKTSKNRPAKTKTVTGPYGEEVLRTRAVTRGNTQRDRQVNKAVRAAKRNNQSGRTAGQTRPPFTRATKLPTKPSARSNSAKYRGRKKK